MNFSGIADTSILGKILRYPLLIIPKTSILPILQGKSRGMKWITGSHDHGCWLGSYEYKKRKILEQMIKPGTCVYDIGAHVGYYTLLMSRLVGRTGHVYAFEPLPRNFELLERHIQLNSLTNIRAVNSAVSATDGVTQFELGNGSATGKISDSGSLSITTLSLDTFIRANNRIPACLKIDVEGGELSVLKGAKELLTAHHPIIFLATHGSSLHANCVQFLQNLGYLIQQFKNDELVATYSHEDLIAFNTPTARSSEQQLSKLGAFNHPTKLPVNPDEAAEWQKMNSDWWNSNPMRYDWKASIPHPEFSPLFFQEIDRRFIESSRYYLPWKKVPFDNLIDYDSLGNKDVLEIGIGNGTHASLITPCARTFTGIDITDYAVSSAEQRLASQHNVTITQMDAEHLMLNDGSFDFIWSWGVIHHTSSTKNVLSEIDRVLRPGGSAVIMVYHRGWYNYYLIGILIYGIILGGFFRKKSLHTLIQDHTDGAIARYYTAQGIQQLLPPTLHLEMSQIAGQKAEVLPIPGGRVKKFIIGLIPDFLARLITHSLRCGSFLIITLKKPSS